MTSGAERGGGLAGVVRLAVGTGVLAVIGPLVATRRWWLSRRRGSSVRVHTTKPGASVGALCQYEVDVDVPLRRERAGRWMVIDAMVRVAEMCDAPGDRHHLVVHRRDQDEVASVPLGHRVQELGERLDRAMSHRSLQRTTHLWLGLPAGRGWPSEVPEPEDDGAVLQAVASIGPRWAAASAYVVGDASVLYRLRLWLPETAGARCVGFFERLEGR